jgi:hypothetical protein
LRSVTLDPARGLVVNLIAALGSCGAAIVAVVIATDSRRERKTERLDAAEAQAMLVLIDVEVSSGTPGFKIDVRNFGAEPMLDVGVDSARFARVPDSKFKVVDKLGPTHKVIDADRSRDCFIVEFVDENGDSMIAGEMDRKNAWHSDNAERDDLDVTIRFMDAHRHHWMRRANSVELAKGT